MPSNLYHFEDHWRIPHSVEEVWEVLSKPKDYPVWWKEVYLSAEPLDADRIAMVAQGRLPYKLRFTIETIRRERPLLIEFKASGDFRTDSSRWVLRPAGRETEVILEWNPIVEKPVVRWLSPVLKPLFRWNHNWTMKVGEQGMIKYLHAIS